jgi:SSS family solute:Na+ symporter
MGHAFFIAIMAFAICFVVTVIVSLVTRPREESELTGLVYSLTEKPEAKYVVWYERPYLLSFIVLAVTAVLNYIYW